MIRKLVWILVLVGLGSISWPAFAQSDSLQTSSLNLKLSPQHLLINCLNPELEVAVGTGNRNSFVFSPQLYSGKTRTVDYLAGRETEAGTSHVFGYGAEIQHKIYRSRSLSGSRSYFAYGLNYHRFDLEFEREGWVEEMQNDGLSYYIYKMAAFHENISRIGGMVMLGNQKPFCNNRLFTDIYSGIGYRKSYSDTILEESQFGSNILDFGRTGFYLVAGLKIGVYL